MNNLGTTKYLADLDSGGILAEPDDIIYCEEDKTIYQFYDEGLGKSFGWKKFEIDKTQLINTGLTEYDINKMVITQLPSLITEAQIAPGKEIIKNYTEKCGHYMLLCNDIHYYTVFNKVSSTQYDLIEDVVIECLTNIGVLQQINFNTDASAVECWIKNEKGCFMFLLFDYDWGIVVCQ